MITEQEFLYAFENVFPSFVEWWNKSDNLSIEEDGSYTYHGVCLEFTEFFKKNYDSFTSSQLTELFDFIEHWMRKDPGDKMELVNALATCFLENIVLTEAGEMSRKHMGQTTCRYVAQWD